MRAAARERLTRRLVGLVVLTVVVTAASALLPPRGSAERTAPVPDEDAAGVEVQTVPLGGLASVVGAQRSTATVPVADTRPVPRPSVAAPPARSATAEFAQDAPPPVREAPTLKDHAAAAFDERRLTPAPAAPAPHPTAAPVGPWPAAPTRPRAEPEPKTPVSRTAAIGRDAWVVQVGVFSTQAKADGVAQQLRSAGLPAPNVEAMRLSSGATRFRVRIPAGTDAGTARLVRDRINALPGAFGASVKSVPGEG